MISFIFPAMVPTALPKNQLSCLRQPDVGFKILRDASAVFKARP